MQPHPAVAASAPSAPAPPPAKPEALDLSSARVTVPDLPFTTPWGKHTLALLSDHLILSNNKTEIRVPLAAVKHVAVSNIHLLSLTLACMTGVLGAR